MKIVVIITSLIVLFPQNLAEAKTAALDDNGRSIKVKDLVNGGNIGIEGVSLNDTRFHASPLTMFEFNEAGNPKLFRGLLFVENEKEAVIETTGSKIDFRGAAIVSYDAKINSTSVFVLNGEARITADLGEGRSLRLERYQGATLEAGESLPSLTRQLGLADLKSWLSGYKVSKEKVDSILAGMPNTMAPQRDHSPEHLARVKLEDYFSSIDAADEFSQPDYYDQKFKDPDILMLEQNLKQAKRKTLNPEEAALIALPSTKIDLGFDVMTLADQDKERVIEKKPDVSRKLASVEKKKKAEVAKKAVPEHDPEVSEILYRLRALDPNSKEALNPQPKRSSPAREPASKPVVPDLVYDYSQNF